MTAAEMELFPMMRPDLVNCDLLIVNELMCPGLNHQDRGHLGNLLATRYKNGRSTFISSRRKPTDIVRLNLMYDDYAGITTGRMFVELNIGYVLEERDGYPEFNALIDDETPHTEAHDAFMRLRMLKPSWLNKRLRERLAVKPGKEWHLMWMLQDSYRLVQRQLAEAQAQTS
ncbi:MAG: hypothetical protein K2Z81_27550 [Cyanobacteria bacterium]|nr:hypothetical protein [Cyanobacteriota bacterium]